MNLFSAAPDTPGLKLEWEDKWVEDFPEDEFSEECKNQPRRIWMYHNRGKRKEKCVVEYTLTVCATEAFLNYGGRFRDVNAADDRDIYIGITRIRFTDDSRSMVRDVAWQDEGKKRFVDYDIRTSWSQLSSDSHFKPPDRDSRQRDWINSVLRPGQLRFRRMLLDNYGSSCCMTGVALEETLEAAHIMPYRGFEFDHPENGLLLRADLHRLFDKLLISVNPDTFKIILSSTLQNDPHYSCLDKENIIFTRKSLRPSKKALRDHWHRFNNADKQNE
jgi:hypothetical protein